MTRTHKLHGPKHDARGYTWPISARRALSARNRMRNWAKKYWPEALRQLGEAG